MESNNTVIEFTKFSNVTIIAGDYQFKCDGHTLGTNFKYFETILEKQENGNPIELNDDEKILEKVLRFTYSNGMMSLTELFFGDREFDILTLFDKYMYVNFKDMVEFCMKKKVHTQQESKIPLSYLIQKTDEKTIKKLSDLLFFTTVDKPNMATIKEFIAHDKTDSLLKRFVTLSKQYVQLTRIEKSNKNGR